MSNDVNRQWLLVRRPQGMISEQDFKFVEQPVPQPGEGQVLVRNLWLSFDPTQRAWMSWDTYVPKVPLGEVMRAAGIGQVVQSRRAAYRPGDLVQGLFGWQDYLATDGQGLLPMRRVPPGVPPNRALSLFGITGLTAYFGVLDVGQVKEGETFVVSAAAGATGSVAGQIAKIKGCKVVGTAGGRAKCDWLSNELGFDGAIDYRDEDVGARLTALCPDGIDVFFDNVGGLVLDEVLARLRINARIVLCGSIARYNDTAPSPGPANYVNLIPKRGKMQGFIVLDYAARFPEAIERLAGWAAARRLQQKEDVAVGLENAPRTLARLFRGENFGKQLLKIADAPLAVRP
jgi:NADPH-dependent curcumin reductase CurA